MTNQEFGNRIGLSPTMASRLRSGNRLPSTATLSRISQEFVIPAADLLAAFDRGPLAFSGFLKSRLPIDEL